MSDLSGITNQSTNANSKTSNTTSTNTNNSTASKAASATSGSLDKDAFLQLLVTQMQYQDPLNPSSNTEYMSQLAQFSSLEQMQNLNQTNQNTSAQSLVGSYVIMKTTDATGSENYVSGLVDFVTMVEGKAKLSINGKYYDYADLDSVVDVDYIAAMAGSDSDSKS